MNGHVDALRRLILAITVRGPCGMSVLDAVVDTGFNGHLAIPDGLIQRLGLPQYGITLHRLADGRNGMAATFVARVEWVTGPVECYAVATQLPYTLLGTAMLDGRQLHVDFGPAKSVEVR